MADTRPPLSSFAGKPGTTPARAPLSSFSTSTTTPSVATAGTSFKQPSLTDTFPGNLPGLKQLTEFGVGLGTETAKTGLNLGKAASIVGSIVPGIGRVMGIPGAATAENYLNKTIPENIDTLKKGVFEDPYKKETSTLSGQAGQLTGIIAPYVETAGGFANITNAGQALVKGSGVAPAVGRIAIGAGTEGLLNYGLTYGLTGGDKQAALTSGLTAGTLKGLTSTFGELMKGLKVDQGLMGKIYKTDKAEQTKELFGKNAGAVDPLSKQALDRGISGNMPQQAKQIATGMATAEQNIGDELLKAGNPEITLKNPERYINALAKEAKQFRDAGADKAADYVESYAKFINDDGKVKATDALSLRRLIDGFTNWRRGMLPTTQLSAEQAGFREMGNELRGQINNIGGTGNFMKDYQFYMAAKDKLIKYAVSSNNKEALDLFDKMLLGESLISSSPYGAAVTAGRKAFNLFPTQTAQYIKNLPQSGSLGTASRGILGRGAGEITK